MQVSPKLEMSVSKEKNFCGLVWTVKGITLGEQGVETILEVFTRLPKGVKQLRMLRGVIVQARSAFEFTAGELGRFGQLVQVITDAITSSEQNGGN